MLKAHFIDGGDGCPVTCIYNQGINILKTRVLNSAENSSSFFCFHHSGNFFVIFFFWNSSLDLTCFTQVYRNNKVIVQPRGKQASKAIIENINIQTHHRFGIQTIGSDGEVSELSEFMYEGFEEVTSDENSDTESEMDMATVLNVDEYKTGSKRMVCYLGKIDIFILITFCRHQIGFIWAVSCRYSFLFKYVPNKSFLIE